MDVHTNNSFDGASCLDIPDDGNGQGASINQTITTYDPSFEIGSLLGMQASSVENPLLDQGFNGENTSLSNSLLNQAFDHGPNSLDVINWEPLDSNTNESEITEQATDPANQLQHNAVAPSFGQHSLFAPIPSNGSTVDFNANNAGINLCRQYRPQSRSYLCREYLPDIITSGDLSMMASEGRDRYYNHPQHFTSPSSYALRTALGQLRSQEADSSSYENNERSLVSHDDYNFTHQLGYRPNQQLNSRPIQSFNTDSRRHTLPSSEQLLYGLDSRRLSQCKPNERRSSASKQAITHPHTPPDGVVSSTKYGQSTSGISTSITRSIKIKRETSASPSPAIEPKSRKKPSRKTIKPTIPTDDDNEDKVPATKTDREYINDLVTAMTEATDAEDNPGMQSTWTKIREKKGPKIREKCVEMLGLLKQAQREQLGDKKAVNPYPNFDHRFEETCAALRTQKTICKHLMEPPYTHTVANDPTYAAQRVRNNRRVNGQKKQAINMGRQALGLQGQGKGKSMKIISPHQAEDSFPDGESSDENSFDDEDESPISPDPPSKPQVSRRKVSKRTRATGSDDDYDDGTYRSPTPKRAKHPRRKATKIQYEESDISALGLSRPSSEYVSLLSSSPILQSKSNARKRADQLDDYPISRVFGSSNVSLPSARSILPELYNQGQRYGHQSDQSSYQQPGFSSSPQLNSSDLFDGGNEAGGHGN